MDATARQVCLLAGGDTLKEGGDAMRVAPTLLVNFQPDAVDRVFTQVGKFTSYVRTDQPIEKFPKEFGILRRKPEKRIFPAGGGFPDLYICFLCIRAAQLKPQENPVDGKHGGQCRVCSCLETAPSTFPSAQCSNKNRHFARGRGTARYPR